jgi:DnaJ-class molecular chaperone
MNFYDILEVNQSSAPEEIKKQFHLLAKKYHPDLFQGEQHESVIDKFKRINEAYAVLSDPEMKKEYDEQMRAH